MAFTHPSDKWLAARPFWRAVPFLLLLAVLAMPTVQAQDSATLARELERLKRDIADLQRTVYAGQQPPPASSAAAADDDGTQAAAAARQHLRIQELERELRELTGAMEEVRYRVDQVGARVEKLIGDVDFRLQALEQRVSGNSGSASPEMQSGSSAAQTGPISEDAGDGTTIITSEGATGPGSQSLSIAEDGELRPGQRLLGQLTQSELDSGEQTGAGAPTPVAPDAVRQPEEPPGLPQAAPLQGNVVAQGAQAGRATQVSLPDGSAKEQYDYAFDFLRKRDFPAAEEALKAFLDRNSDGPLAANAMYWLGETYYARENFRDAAAVFLDAYTNYPTGSKASHSLLKLGMSLGALGKNEQACLTFDELRTKYRDAEPRVLSRADTEAASLACP